MDNIHVTSRNRKWLGATSLVAMGLSASVLLGSAPSTNPDASVSLRRRLQEQQQPIPMYNPQFQAWPPPGQEGQQPQFLPYPPQGFPQGGFQAIPVPFPGQQGQQGQGQGGSSQAAPAPPAQEESKPPPLQHELQKQPAQEAEKPPQVSREKYLGMTFPTPEKMPQFLRNTMDHGNDSDLVFFWHIPKTAGSMMKTIMSTCYGLRRAEKLEHPASMVMIKDTVLNVDTASPKGIVEAKEFEIADSGMIDVIISSFVLSASSLFTQSHKGRAFTLLRHPVDTAASNFVKRKGRSKDLRDLELELHQYVSQDWYPDNYMVRQLSGVLPGDAITEHHMDLAKNLLSAKFFIGIVEEMEETVRQLQMYYGWKERPGMEGCVEQFVGGKHESFMLRKRQKPAKDSEEWNMIVEKEKFDMELYYFGLEIFSKQQRMYPNEKKEESFF